MTHSTPPPSPFPPSPRRSPLGSPRSARLTARSPEDLLAASAVVLGFWPTESVVMLTLDAVASFHARVDLPADAAGGHEVARVLVEPAVQHGATQVVLLVHTADRERGLAAWRALASVFRRHGVGVVQAMMVGPDRWWWLEGGDDGADDGADDGIPYDAERLAAHPFLAQAVFDGRVLHRSRAELAATLEPDPAAVARVEALAAGLPTRAWAALEPAGVQLFEGTWAHTVVGRHLDAGSRPADLDAARLLCGMQSLRVRDAAWAAITRARARPATGLFADLVRRAPHDLLAPAAALLGWAAWQSGDGALAWCAVDRCEAADPDYGLAGLLADALERAVPPSVWADGFDWKQGLGGRETG